MIDKRIEFLRDLLALCRRHDVELSGQYGSKPVMFARFRGGEVAVDIEIDADVARGAWDAQSHAVVL